MLITMVVFLFLISALYERATVLKQAETKVRVVHISIMLVSFGVLVLYSLNIDVPSPGNAIVNIVKAIFRLEG